MAKSPKIPANTVDSTAAPSTPRTRSYFKTGLKRDKANPLCTAERPAKVLTAGQASAAESASSPNPSRNPAISRGAIIRRARERLERAADAIVEKHLQIVDKGIEFAASDPHYLETARKATQWTIENISGIEADGNKVRLVDKDDKQSTAPIVKIGIALGGLPKPQQSLPAVAVLPTNDDDDTAG